MEQLQADFLRMLKEDKNEGTNFGENELTPLLDMKRLYFLLSRVTDGLPNTANTFQVYLTETGSKIIVEQREKNLKDALSNAVRTLIFSKLKYRLRLLRSSSASMKNTADLLLYAS